ncbi:MAG: hypothetical protein COA79_05280 [Planctomycetota bacterium]|nr:MAG: hypothetical protein COA79_05280 [Planctomycetota bacterium]
MQISKYLKESSILLDYQLDTNEEEENQTLKKVREVIFKQISTCLETVGKINNTTKLYNEFLEREKKDSCCIGDHIALPHLRTLQCKELLISVITSKQGIKFNAFDDEPVKIFFSFVAPRYDDNLYKTLYKNISRIFQDPYTIDTLLSFEQPGELIRYLKKEFS